MGIGVTRGKGAPRGFGSPDGLQRREDPLRSVFRKGHLGGILGSGLGEGSVEDGNCRLQEQEGVPRPLPTCS